MFTSTLSTRACIYWTCTLMNPFLMASPTYRVCPVAVFLYDPASGSTMFSSIASRKFRRFFRLTSTTACTAYVFVTASASLQTHHHPTPSITALSRAAMSAFCTAGLIICYSGIVICLLFLIKYKIHIWIKYTNIMNYNVKTQQPRALKSNLVTKKFRKKSHVIDVLV